MREKTRMPATSAGMTMPDERDRRQGATARLGIYRSVGSRLIADPASLLGDATGLAAHPAVSDLVNPGRFDLANPSLSIFNMYHCDNGGVDGKASTREPGKSPGTTGRHIP
jgi:hypothetical protein